MKKDKFIYLAFASFLVGTILFFTFTYPITIEYKTKVKQITDSYEYMKFCQSNDFNFMYGFYFGFFAIGTISLYCYCGEYVSFGDMFKRFKKEMKENLKFRTVIMLSSILLCSYLMLRLTIAI